MAKANASKDRFIPIRLKLLSATIISGILALLIAGAGLYCMHLLNLRLKEVVEVAAEKVKLSNLLRQDLSSIVRSERNLLLASDEKEFDRIATTMDGSFESIDSHVHELRLVLDDENRQPLDRFTQKLAEWEENHRLLREYSGMDHQRKARELSLGEGEAAFNQFETSVNRWVSARVAEPNTTQTQNPPEHDNEQPSSNQNSNANVPNAPNDGQPTNLSNDYQTREYLSQLGELRRDALKLQRVEKNLILQASISTLQKPEDSIKPFRDQVSQRIANLKKTLAPQEKNTLEEVERKLTDYLLINDEIVNIVQQKGNDGYALVQEKGIPIARECESIANSMVSSSERSLDQYGRESSSLYMTFRNTLLALSLAAVAASVVISMLVGSKIAENIRKLSGYTKDIHRANDLSRPVPKVANDEIGELSMSFDAMRISLLRQSNQLARLNESLEHKNEEMEQFVYSVSHDLKSPLVSCKGLVGLINEDINDGDFEEVKNSAERLSTVADQMSATIDDILTFSRIGRHQLEMVLVKSSEMVAQLQEEWWERLEAANVKLNVESELPSIRADPISIRRVFDNLIGNAIKYAGEAENATINIGSTREGNKVRFYVRDNGPGIEPEYHEKIFGLFQRLNTTKKGTGIGLASVAKIMRQHWGRVWVESQPGRGATFWIELPDDPS